MVKKTLTQKFFERPALKVAEELLEKYLCRQITGDPTSPGSRTSKICLIITETEAYVGPEDKASHASRGKTKRNKPMFGKPGIWYVYFTYGMHWMLNIVTGPKDFPAAVLIRGALPTSHAKIFRDLAQRDGVSRAIRQQANMRVNKNFVHRSRLNRPAKSLNGPAKLTKFLRIDGRFNTKPASQKTGLWIEDRGVRIKSSQIRRAPRIGVEYAKAWAKKPYRFCINK